LSLREEHRLRVSVKRVLRRIFGPRGNEIGGWRKFCNEGLHKRGSSSNIIRIIKSRGMRYTGYIARMGRRGMHTGFSLETRKERKH
jgi:hypothetical protein